MDTKLLGRWGEQQAAEYLKKKGYEIVGLNYRCRHGEIDIIAKNKIFIVFAEVKLRRSASFAEAREFVTPAKQQKLIVTAGFWLISNPTELQPRFDVLEVYAPRGMDPAFMTINHIENAFHQ